MEDCRRRSKPSLPLDAIEIRVKYHDQELFNEFRKYLDQKYDIFKIDEEFYNNPVSSGKYYRFMRFRKEEGQ